MGKRVLIIAGEASGDLHGANLVRAMQVVNPAILFVGMGGHYMRKAGVELLVDAAETAVMGLPSIAHLNTIFKAFRLASAKMLRWRPNLIILIDYPEFNLLLAKKANRLKIPVMYYISPQIWAWRPGRIKTIRRRVDRMAVILPFEEAIYRQAGVKVSFVGHPLLDVVSIKDNGELPYGSYVKSKRSRLVGILPGSRPGELARLTPVMLDAAALLAERLPKVDFLMPLAPTIRPEQVHPYLQGRELPLTLVENSTYEVIQMCELIIVASGTVTLEAAILGTPLVVVYRVNPLTYWVGRKLVKVKKMALANLVSGETLAPELMQQDANPERIAAEALQILNNQKRQEWIRERLGAVHKKLGTPGASTRAAAIALELMGC